jgi:hypothetical protein
MSIISLIKFISENGGEKNPIIGEICKEASSQLNVLGRETSLFNCMVVPDDEL